MKSKRKLKKEREETREGVGGDKEQTRLMEGGRERRSEGVKITVDAERKEEGGGPITGEIRVEPSPAFTVLWYC